jgi:DNA polymerase III alpha subunit (gram-positive type)
MDKRKKYILVFDTETAPIKPSSVCDSSNSLVYDFGCGVYDKKGNCYETRSFVNRDIFLDEFEKMQSAYYCKKIPMYINDLANGTRLLRTTEEIQMEIAELIEKYNISTISAHNARFDLGALATTMEWLTNGEEWFFFPNNRDIEVWDTLGMARDVIAKKPSYKAFCKENDQMTKNGRVRLTAESIYQYITDNPTFEEKHTGLEDVEIESKILAYCLKQHKAMPRRTLTTFEKSIFPTEWTEENVLDFFEKMLDI